MSNSATITCPNCGASIDIEEVLAHSIEDRLKKEYTEKLAVERARLDKTTEEEVRKRILQASGELEQRLGNEIQSRYELKEREWQKRLDTVTKQAEEMKRRAEQGSQQLAGEVQELAIEEYLRSHFRSDDVTEIGKGQRGGDCIHVVKSNDAILGTIYYESKRTKTFSNEWIDKLKEDMRVKSADVGVIVSETLPKGMDHFGSVRGVWVCTFEEFKALAFVLRELVARVGQVGVTQANRGDKMSLLYDFLTGSEFRMQMEALVEGFHAMREDLARERVAMERLWKQREKQLEKVLMSTAGMYGSIKGIAGSDVGHVGLLDLGGDDAT